MNFKEGLGKELLFFDGAMGTAYKIHGGELSQPCILF